MAARDRRANATTVGQDQIALQSGSVLCLNLDRRKFAETSVYTVNGIRSSDRFGYPRMGQFDCGAAGGIKPYRSFFAENFLQISQSYSAGSES